MYIQLRKGDHLPTVAYAQHRMNQSGLLVEPIEVDGWFGPDTEGAVREVQKAHGFAETGIIATDTWDALCQDDRRQVIEAIDAGQWNDPHRPLYARDVEVLQDDRDYLMSGTDPLMSIVYGQNLGLERMVENVTQLGSRNAVLLLRFHGHGSPGRMALAVGASPPTRYGDSLLAGEDLAYPTIRARLAPLRALFGPFGSAELHGCNVGRGAQGETLLAGLAVTWGVPVSAGTRSQYGGAQANRFEGPVRTFFPEGASLRDWAQGQSQRML